MIIATTQPRTFCPNPKSHPILWGLATDEHLEQIGSRPSFTVTFNDGGSSGVVTLLGTSFTIGGAEPYTSTSFQYTGAASVAAANFVNMIKSNYLFLDWTVSTSSSGSTYNVFVTSTLYREEDNFVFSVPSPMVIVSANGQQTILRNYTIWYQLWRFGFPITKQKFAKVPTSDLIPYQIVEIDLKEDISKLLSSTFPSWSLASPIDDQSFQAEISLRFGGVTKDIDGVNTYGQTYESSKSIAVNSVFQNEESNEFRNHCTAGIFRVRWLTDRPQQYAIPEDSFEWAWIWIENDSIYTIDPEGFKVVYVFTYEGGVTQTFEQIIYSANGATVVPTGTGCPSIKPYIGNCIKYTVTVYGKYFDGTSVEWRQYSDELTRYVKLGVCCDEEVYFIEDKGSWGTVCFRFTDEVQLLQDGYEFETKLAMPLKDKPDVFPNGGRTSVVESAINKCFLISDKMDRCGDVTKYFQQCLRSPFHYIRTTRLGQSPIQTRRRIVIDRNNSQIFKRGESTRIVLAYTYTTDLNLQ